MSRKIFMSSFLLSVVSIANFTYAGQHNEMKNAVLNNDNNSAKSKPSSSFKDNVISFN